MNVKKGILNLRTKKTAEYVSIYLNPPLWVECDTNSILKWSTAGSDSEFSFSLIVYLTDSYLLLDWLPYLVLPKFNLWSHAPKIQEVKVHIRHVMLWGFKNNNCPVGWGCKIHRLLLCWGVRPPSNVCPRYDTKQSDGEVPVMLELWGMQSALSLPSLPDSL